MTITTNFAIINTMNIQDNAEYFKYLYRLQRSGRTNMMGAGPYLQQSFGLDRNEAREILLFWMDKYEEIATALNIEI